MARGDVLLVSQGRDVWARVIVAVTGNPRHHAAIDLGDGTCISAERKGVQRKPITDFKRVEYLTIGTPEQREQAAWHAEQLIGQPYNVPAFILAGLASLHLVPQFLEQALADLAEDDGFTCSMLVDRCFEASGYDGLPGSAVYTWPGELIRLRDTTCPTQGTAPQRPRATQPT